MCMILLQVTVHNICKCPYVTLAYITYGRTEHLQMTVHNTCKWPYTAVANDRTQHMQMTVHNTCKWPYTALSNDRTALANDRVQHLQMTVQNTYKYLTLTLRTSHLQKHPTGPSRTRWIPWVFYIAAWVRGTPWSLCTSCLGRWSLGKLRTPTACHPPWNEGKL